MRFLSVLVAASSLAVLVVACSSSDSASIPDGGDSGNASGSSGSSGSSGASGSSGTSGSSGDPDASTPDGSSPDASAGFNLTSSAFAQGGKIPAANTCTGTNVSPAFAWTAGPAATKSYAMVLEDKSNMLIHSVIYDIPAAVLALPADVEKKYAPAAPAGSHTTKPGFGGGFGYAGPCPPEQHTYEFTLYALDVATLPTADMTTGTIAGNALIQAHMLATAKLSGTYQKP